MVEEPKSASGAMEGGGAYNKHARLQAGASAYALPLWEKALRAVALDDGPEPVVIVDYGSSQGKNSLAPMRIALEILRSRVGQDRPIVVFHTDLPTNDFNTLFELLETDPDRYSRNDPNVFLYGVGRSFYHSVLPPNHVHLGWCCFAAMWVNSVPTVPPDHIYFPRMTGVARAAFDRQGAQDWEAFLSLRARELRPGSRLVVTVPGANEEGWCGFERIMDHGNAALTDMAEEGAISAEERARMVLPVWPRRKRDLLAPFARDGRFCGMIVESSQTAAFPDAAWADYQRDGNREVLASKHVGFFRTTFARTLAASLANAQDVQACRAFGDRLEHGLKQRLIRDPSPINSLVETVVLAKLNST